MGSIVSLGTADFVININMEMSRSETDPRRSPLQVMLDFVFAEPSLCTPQR